MLVESKEYAECCDQSGEEQLDELSPRTLADYIRGASDDIGHYNWMRGVERHDKWDDLDDWEQERRLRRNDKEYNREKGIDRALNRLANEGFGEESGISESDLADVLCNRILTRKPELLQQYGPSEVVQACESVAEFHAGAEELGSSDISIMLREVERELRDYADYKQEQLDEISDELVSRVEKARTDQMRSAPRSNRDELMSKYDSFSKNQKLQHQRNKRHQKVGLKGSDPISDYYQGSGSSGRYFGDSIEHNEQPINELSPSTLGSYIKKASHEKGYHGTEAGRYGEKRDRSAERSHALKGEKRQRGINTAVDKLLGMNVDESKSNNRNLKK